MSALKTVQGLAEVGNYSFFFKMKIIDWSARVVRDGTFEMDEDFSSFF